MSRLRRHAVIRDVLSGQAVPSHGVLKDALAERGITVTQATLSRDLREMGVLKSPAGYALPEAVSGDRMDRALASRVGTRASAVGQHVLDIAPANGLIVLRTSPGSAGVVALELDRNPPELVCGTVAGDDTVFVAISENASPRRVAAELAWHLGLTPAHTQPPADEVAS